MTKFIFVASAALILLFSTADAAIYKGQKEFVKKCVKCHDTGQNFVSSHKMRYWKKMMAKKGKRLAELHLENPKAKKSWSYFKSRKYTRKTKHLKQFLVEYAKDSGNVPACN
ncbi:cytochrome C [Sulfurimonas marina]|uniref:Cytochrome C n=1 Tax=Sulfurimonas marina TaxID=2590551 RepID=A0A7M1AUL0_9BACT|nr:cytochrome C [Sulfurimonas marina]QOP41066.1 cytochrome C [Sulfurimonas marina]